MNATSYRKPRSSTYKLSRARWRSNANIVVDVACGKLGGEVNTGGEVQPGGPFTRLLSVMPSNDSSKFMECFL